MEVKLGELGFWGSGGTPLASRADYYGGEIPWITIEDLNDGVVTKSIRTISQLGLENSSTRLIPAETLLIAMYGSIGKLGISGMSCTTNQAIAFCKCDPKRVEARFLFYLLLKERSSFIHAGRGGTQQNISQDFLKNYEICLPDLPAQREILARLDGADRLRRQRRHALEMSDRIPDAAFLELFGDFRRAERKWPVERLERHSKIVSGVAKGQKYGNQHVVEVPYLRVANVQNGYVDLSEIKKIRVPPPTLMCYASERGTYL